ncbi:uncharacterized protein TNCV_4738521 [Trichonephila clavipes]|nr:uncharacterized protein TNCV_4738521 [Trichonephila clavipes]
MYGAFRHGGTLNSRRAASLLVWLVEERWEAPGHPQDFIPPNWGGTKPNRSVTCMVLKAKANVHDEIGGQQFLSLIVILLLCLEEEFRSKQSTAVLQRLTYTPGVQSGACL